MKKVCSCVLLFLVVSVFGEPACWGLETLMIQEPNRTHVIKGYFKRSGKGIAFPAETIFSYEVQTGTSNIHEAFYFAGQKGDDSFEIRHTWATFAGFRGGKPEGEILKVVFEADAEYPLPMSYLAMKDCSKKDVPSLKMISLGNNQLGYRIILPVCLEETLRKAKEEGNSP